MFIPSDVCGPKAAPKLPIIIMIKADNIIGLRPNLQMFQLKLYRMLKGKKKHTISTQNKKIVLRTSQTILIIIVNISMI